MWALARDAGRTRCWAVALKDALLERVTKQQHLLMQIRGSGHRVPWDPRLESLCSNHVHVDDHVSF